MATTKIRRGGTVVIPTKTGPAGTGTVEVYSVRRKVELLLNNAVDTADYARTTRAVRKLRVDPRRTQRRRP